MLVHDMKYDSMLNRVDQQSLGVLQLLIHPG